MTKYISLDALVAEIERVKEKEIGIGLNAYDMGEENGKAEMCNKFLSLLDTLEVKEVQEEPASKDLEKAAEEWDESLYRSDAFKAGAQWQKEKDAKLIINAKDDGYRLGLATMKQQMMKDTIDAKVYNEAYPTKIEIETNTFMQKLKHGDNVKLIIIKED